jgi:predicted RNase H-like nuclease (RuvC/YqgF family)
MGMLKYIKSLFWGKDIRKHRPPKPIQIKPAVKERIPPFAKEKPVTITIGLDFGTSTTKCIVNLEGE